MPKKKSKLPLSSFDPRLIQLLIKGSRERVVVPFIGEGKKAEAHLFHRRLHTVRARMLEENHESYPIVAKALARLFWGPRAQEAGLTPSGQDWTEDYNGHRGAYLVLQPRDTEFEDIFKNLKLEGVSPNPEAPALTPQQEKDELTSWLEELSTQQEKPNE